MYSVLFAFSFSDVSVVSRSVVCMSSEFVFRCGVGDSGWFMGELELSCVCRGVRREGVFGLLLTSSENASADAASNCASWLGYFCISY